MLRKKLIKIGMTIGVGAMAIGVFWNLNNNNNNNKIKTYNTRRFDGKYAKRRRTISNFPKE